MFGFSPNPKATQIAASNDFNQNLISAFMDEKVVTGLAQMIDGRCNQIMTAIETQLILFNAKGKEMITFGS